jgi:hypothetical protein
MKTVLKAVLTSLTIERRIIMSTEKIKRNDWRIIVHSVSPIFLKAAFLEILIPDLKKHRQMP